MKKKLLNFYLAGILSATSVNAADNRSYDTQNQPQIRQTHSNHQRVLPENMLNEEGLILISEIKHCLDFSKINLTKFSEQHTNLNVLQPSPTQFEDLREQFFYYRAWKSSINARISKLLDMHHFQYPPKESDERINDKLSHFRSRQMTDEQYLTVINMLPIKIAEFMSMQIEFLNMLQQGNTGHEVLNGLHTTKLHINSAENLLSNMHIKRLEALYGTHGNGGTSAALDTKFYNIAMNTVRYILCILNELKRQQDDQMRNDQARYRQQYLALQMETMKMIDLKAKMKAEAEETARMEEEKRRKDIQAQLEAKAHQANQNQRWSYR